MNQILSLAYMSKLHHNSILHFILFVIEGGGFGDKNYIRSSVFSCLVEYIHFFFLILSHTNKIRKKIKDELRRTDKS